MKKQTLLLIGLLLISLSVKLSAQDKLIPSSKISLPDVPAKFPEGDFDAYILNHLKFPKIFNREGSMLFYLNIKIDSLGKASVQKIPLKTSPEINGAFIDVVNHAPQWLPAKLQDKPVSAFAGFGFIVSFDRESGMVKANLHQFVGGHHPVDSNVVYAAVQISPQFPGGEPAFQKFIKQDIPQLQDIHGTIFIQFVVERNGQLSHFFVVRSPTEKLSEEVKLRLSKCPAWTPGQQNGQTVRVQVTESIAF
jgi:hypothetical protein